MNERIKELAEQATERFGVKIWDESAGVFYTETHLKLNQEKFAELIVRECARVCLAQRDPANLNYKPSERFAEAVKQHFGVDE
jgi:hypothetical protein